MQRLITTADNRDVFNCTEMFCNRKCRHGNPKGMFLVRFENQYFNRLRSV